MRDPIRIQAARAFIEEAIRALPGIWFSDPDGDSCMRYVLADAELDEDAIEISYRVGSECDRSVRELTDALGLDWDALSTRQRADLFHAVVVVIEQEHLEGEVRRSIERRLEASPLPSQTQPTLFPPFGFSRDLGSGGTGKFSSEGPPPPHAELTSRIQPVHQLIPGTAMPSAARRFRESVRSHVRKQRDLDRLGELTARHRVRDLVRWPRMCRRAGLQVRLAGARDVTAEQILAVKRSGLWQSVTLGPIFSGLRTYCREEGNAALASLASVWKLPRRVRDNRKWLSERQLALCYGMATGRVRVQVALEGFLGLREDSVRSMLVSDFSFEDQSPRIDCPAKGREGDRIQVPLDAETAGVMRSWIEAEGLRQHDRVYRWGHATYDSDLRVLGRRVGLPFPLSGHVLRRSWARITYLADPTQDQLRIVQRILGHRDLATTWHYIGWEYLDMAAGLARFHERMRIALVPERG